MSDKSAIEWTDASWNPVRGQNARHTCARISPGCDHCYAAAMTRRGLGGTAPIDYGRGETPNDPARLDMKALLQPLRWKKPRKIFVCSMTDLFGTWVPDEWIDHIFAVMAWAQQHTFIVLTKRPTRMRDYLSNPTVEDRVTSAMCDVCSAADGRPCGFPGDDCGLIGTMLPLGHVWLGTTIESDAYTWRADRLRETPAAVRWVSAEPLLSALPSLDLTWIDWLVTGGESGHGARPMHPDWVRDLRDRCTENGTAFFHKQNGEYVEVDGLRTHAGPVPRDDRGPGTTWLTKDGRIVPFGSRDAYHCSVWGSDVIVKRVGKKAAGRLLDGRTWDEFPRVGALAGASA